MNYILVSVDPATAKHYFADADLHITSYKPNVRHFPTIAAAVAARTEYEKNGGDNDWKIAQILPDGNYVIHQQKNQQQRKTP